MLTITLIAAARADLNRHFARNLRIAAKRAMRRVRLAFARFAEARRHRQELEFLLHADDRMLADIGVTRADVQFAFGSDTVRWGVARSRDEARHAGKPGMEVLPQVNAPTLAPALPRLRVTHDSFR